MSRTAMGIDHLEATGMPDPNIPGGQLPVPPQFIGRWNQAPLGFIHVEPASQVPFDWQPPDDPAGAPVGLTGTGDQEWIYVFVDPAGTALAAGDVCTRIGLITGGTSFGSAVVDHTPASSASAAIIGVAQYAIPAGFFGFILRTGPGVVNYIAPAPAGGLPLISAAAIGEADEGTILNAGFGVSLTGAVGVDNAILSCTG